MAFRAAIRRLLQHAGCSLDQTFDICKSGKSYVTGAAYQQISTEVIGSKKNIGLIRFRSLNGTNSLSTPMFNEIAKSIADYDTDDSISTIIVTGNEKFFSSGGDLSEIRNRTYSKNQRLGYLNNWENTTKCRKPIIAAVNGPALGAGFEFAMICDIIYASEKAKFGLLEVKVGITCGGGGTQRLARSVSKMKAMELVLSGKVIDAYEAEKMGIISRVCPADKLLEDTMQLAEKIGTHSAVAVQLAKEAVNQAFETTLSIGLDMERHLCDILKTIP